MHCCCYKRTGLLQGDRRLLILGSVGFWHLHRAAKTRRRHGLLRWTLPSPIICTPPCTRSATDTTGCAPCVFGVHEDCRANGRCLISRADSGDALPFRESCQSGATLMHERMLPEVRVAQMSPWWRRSKPQKRKRWILNPESPDIARGTRFPRFGSKQTIVWAGWHPT
jgi:hypothetical protein